MRALFIPQIVAAAFQSESDIYGHTMILRAMAERGPYWAYMWVRESDTRFVDDVDREKRITYFFEEPENSFYQQMAFVDLARLQTLFSWQNGMYPVDVVFTSRAGIAPVMSMALGVGSDYVMPVVIIEPRVYGPGEHGHNKVHPVQLAVRAAGYASCYGVYWSKHEKRMALDAASLFCSPALLKDWDERSIVADVPVMVNELVHGVKKDVKRKRLIFAGRLNANKRWKDVLDAYVKVAISRGDVEIWVHSGTGVYGKLSKVDKERALNWHRVTERLPADEYWSLLGSAHAGAYYSKDEGANITIQELIMAGVVMVLPDKPWVKHLFEPLSYPFVVKSAQDIPVLLDWILDHYSDAQRAIAPIREFIQRERSWNAFTQKLEPLWEMLEKHPRPKPFHMYRRVAENLIRERGYVAFRDVLAVTANWRKGTPARLYPRAMYAGYQAVRDMDALDDAEPVLMEVTRDEEAGD